MNEESNSPDEKIDLTLYEYPFENLVFEGGGEKGLAYCGVLEVLENVGIQENIKRIAGTSAGSITASLMAVGFTSAQIRDIMDVDINKVVNDHSLGWLSVPWNGLKHYGWNPGNRFVTWFGETLEQVGAPADITFSQVLQKYGKELCIVVTNVDRMTTEYFHPKTTPQLQVRQAVRMSMSIPLYMAAVEADVHGCGLKDQYVDGGMLCNYPITCFDGWWLSMKSEDSFVVKLNDIGELSSMFESKSSFGKYNDKTLGFVLFAQKEKDSIRNTIEKEIKKNISSGEIPNTKLGNKYRAQIKLREQDKEQYKNDRTTLDEAIKAFRNALEKEKDKSVNHYIHIEELAKVLKNEDFKKYSDFLFSQNASAEKVWQQMGVDKGDRIDYGDLDRYLEQKAYSITARSLAFRRSSTDSISSFLLTLNNVVLDNVEWFSFKDADIKRTVGINTGHVGSLDFDIEEADKTYIVNQGKVSTERFLRGYVKDNSPPMKSSKGKDASADSSPK